MSGVNLYFAGGAGALISRLLPKQWPEFCASPDCFYLDTSNSEQVYHRADFIYEQIQAPETKAGSGGLRGSKVELIKEHIPRFMVKHPPADVNIIVVSSSGASGAVIAHFLLNEILAQGKKAIILVSQAPNNFLRATNSLKFLMGVRSLANHHQNSAVGYVYESNGNSFKEADNNLIQDLIILLHFFSGKVGGVDSTDLEILLSPDKLPDLDMPYGLYSMGMIFDKEYTGEVSPISILTLSDVGGMDDIGSGAGINFSGITDQNMLTSLGMGEDAVLSLAIYNHHLPMWVNNLSEAVDRLKTDMDGRKTPKLHEPKTIKLQTTDNDIII